jgi:hypothetical protein
LVSHLYLFLQYVYGELRAKHFAQPTTDTHPAIIDLRRMVALRVKFFGNAQHFLRTELHAKTTTLAPFFQDLDLAMRDFQFVYI